MKKLINEISSEISDDHLAVLRPFQGQQKGDLEADLHLMYDRLDEFNNYVREKHKY